MEAVDTSPIALHRPVEPFTDGLEEFTSTLPPDRFLDRELSWLNFNNRVLDLAKDKLRVPLLERAKFLAIFASNLDEFYMVRVAGLKRRIAAGVAVPTVSGMMPRDVHSAILNRTRELVAEHARVFTEEIRPELVKEGIEILRWNELTGAEKDRMNEFFAERIFPVLTPLAVDPSHPFPYISGLSINLAVLVRNPETGARQFARVKVPTVLPRFLMLSEGRFVALEDVIARHLDQLFSGMHVVQHHTFRVTRNEDVEVEEDDAENLLLALEKELLRRKVGRPPVRLEVEDDIDPKMLELLGRRAGHQSSERCSTSPVRWICAACFPLADIDRADLKYPAFLPSTHPHLAEVETAQPADMFAALKHRDVLLHHPYDSFATSVQRFIEQAADDPQVLAIKQTLYRTSGDSPIIDALIEASEAGKQVLALVEIKARFDEQANIAWARRLEQHGCHVVYGLLGLKTHCKLSMVVRDEPDGLRRYAHIGTGNYNPKTARLYEDTGLLTANPIITEDIGRLFNHLSGMSQETQYKRLLVAPHGIRTGLIDRINNEIANHEDGKPAGYPDQGELACRRGDLRRALPGLPGRRGRGPVGARDLHDPPGCAGFERKHPGDQHSGPLSGAQQAVLVRQRRSTVRSGWARLTSCTATWTGGWRSSPPSRSQHTSPRSVTCSISPWTRARRAGSWNRTVPGPRTPPIRTTSRYSTCRST